MVPILRQLLFPAILLRALNVLICTLNVRDGHVAFSGLMHHRILTLRNTQ